MSVKYPRPSDIELMINGWLNRLFPDYFDLVDYPKGYDDLIDFDILRTEILSDVSFAFEADPAATSIDEIILCYPGFLAVSVYRMAHLLYDRGIPLLPRMMTEYAHSNTGIDIHPGAKIAYPFFIDHGTGVVIGETAEIGRFVKIYQGVTLGARSIDGRDKIQGKRHPTIGNNCVIYAGATILGGDTVIGDNCVIGGNVWLTHSVPEGEKIYYREK